LSYSHHHLRQTKNKKKNKGDVKKSSSPSAYRILIVDDEADITTTLKMGLENSGLFLVDTFTDSVQALSQFKPRVYNLLLLDVRMPKINGFELYHEIKKIDKTVKVYFITAYEVYYETLKKEEFPSLNVGCFIKKPIQIKDLISRIKEELQLSQSLQ
jgi:DNA-binding response OmpR family regulator